MTHSSEDGGALPSGDQLSKSEAKYRVVRALGLATLGIVAARERPTRLDTTRFIARLTGFSIDEVSYSFSRMSSGEVDEVRWDHAVRGYVLTDNPAAQDAAYAEVIDVGLNIQLPREMLKDFVGEQVSIDSAEANLRLRMENHVAHPIQIGLTNPYRP